ncbi:MAG: amino acid ABC transporter permease [Hyphomicrobiales bacterium]
MAIPVVEGYVRSADAPVLPPPPSMVGVQGWLLKNLFSSLWNSIASILAGAFFLWLLWGFIEWGVTDAVWSGDTREACLGEGVGACWPFIRAKMPQWIYGFFPIDQRWRVNLCFLLGAAGLIPMMIPSVPYKNWNALYLLIAYPLIAFILLTGGHVAFSTTGIGAIGGVLLLSAALLPVLAFGVEEGVRRNALGLIFAAAALLIWIATLWINTPFVWLLGNVYSLGRVVVVGLLIAAAIASGIALLAARGPGSGSVLRGWLVGWAVILLALILVSIDFGLQPVETQQWGGLIVTLVVSITGIVASLPIGILLALGRRSKMPVVKLFSVVFIELWRGVPLITVLFMSSVMLPLFLPPGTSFDKLLRALIGVALFSSAYMAEVVRGGLQAIPKGQYEGAMALGLSYWHINNLIALPQALKISIPNIVGNFISLFKDTTLVLIIGLFDLLGIVQAGLRDANWATASSASTGYFTVALIFWCFCFGMSRYSIFMERRLATERRR